MCLTFIMTTLSVVVSANEGVRSDTALNSRRTKMRRTIIYISGDREQPEARFKRLLKSHLNELLGISDDIPKEVTIEDNQLCINGTPIGDWRIMCNFTSEGPFLIFDYGDDKERYISFGFKGFDDDYYKVYEITEMTKGANAETKYIYRKFN